MLTPSSIDEQARTIERGLAEHRDAIVTLMRDLVAIDSSDGNLRRIEERLLPEMEKLGFDEARIDINGSIIGRIGKGTRTLILDTHLDTAGVGDPQLWAHDPFRGQLTGDVFAGRGAGDGKGAAAAMVYALPLIRELGLSDEFTVYFLGGTSERCEGRAAEVFCEVDRIRADFVVMGSPTSMRVTRGCRGRQQFRVEARGKASHAAMPWNGHNPIYDLCTYAAAVPGYASSLGSDDFLGSASCTVSSITSSGPSSHSTPDLCTLLLDRRTLPHETAEQVLEEVKRLAGAEHVEVHKAVYDEPSWNGYTYLVEKTFPAWLLDAQHPLVTAGQRTREALGLPAHASTRADISSDAVFWGGKRNIPCIGFGPGDESKVHTPQESVSLRDLVQATAFYALLPAVLRHV